MKTAIGTMVFVKVNLRSTIKKRQLADDVGENLKKLLALLVVGKYLRHTILVFDGTHK